MSGVVTEEEVSIFLSQISSQCCLQTGSNEGQACKGVVFVLPPHPKPSHCYPHSQADGPAVWPWWPPLPVGDAQCLVCFLLLNYHPGTEPGSPALQADSLPSETLGKLSFNPQEETKRKASKERQETYNGSRIGWPHPGRLKGMRSENGG